MAATLASLSLFLALALLILQVAQPASAMALRIVHGYKNVWVKVAPSQTPEGTSLVVDNRDLYGYQRWYLTISDDGNYAEILNDASGLFVAAPECTGSEVVVVYRSEDASAWRFQPVHTQHRFVIRLMDSDLVWTLEGDRVVLRPFVQSKEQQWDLVDDGDEDDESERSQWQYRLS
ncbi:hypothetical protein BGZ73_009093 [Actinomortierella ambigua]|nr:hypothetical protein BGZ73_009093 [Actinomortierella ambigua]